MVCQTAPSMTSSDFERRFSYMKPSEFHSAKMQQMSGRMVMFPIISTVINSNFSRPQAITSRENMVISRKRARLRHS